MKRPLLTVLLIAVAVAVIVIARAPASLISRVLQDVPDAHLIAPSGTIWNGRGTLSVARVTLGELRWTVQPAQLITGRLAADFTLQSTELDLSGMAGVGLASASAEVNGEVSAAAINRWLAVYDISIDSDLTLTAVDVELSELGEQPPVIDALSGEVVSEAGSVRYRLAGRTDLADLPALQATLSSESGSAEAVVVQDGQAAELMTLGLSPSGEGRVAITKRFTQLLNRPWPGSDPGHAVVIEVREQLF